LFRRDKSRETQISRDRRHNEKGVGEVRKAFRKNSADAIPRFKSRENRFRRRAVADIDKDQTMLLKTRAMLQIQDILSGVGETFCAIIVERKAALVQIVLHPGKNLVRQREWE
jgi:hypothetical protein